MSMVLKAGKFDLHPLYESLICSRGCQFSKPGAAAAAVYLHHVVVGLHKGGHGSLLGEVCFSCARVCLVAPSTPFVWH